MTKIELMETYTAEQLAEMVIKQEEENQKLYDAAKKWQKESEQHRKVYQTVCHLEDLESESIRLKSEVKKFQNASEVKNDEILKLKRQISSLEEGNGRLQAKVDTYNNYLLPRCTKKARELIDKNCFNGVKIATLFEWNNRKKIDMNISEIQKCQEEYEKLMKESPLQRIIDGIARDILEQKNNAMAIEFTRIMCDLLKEYGVHVHCIETKYGERITTNSIEEQYGIVFDSMDFSQHDKEYTDKIEELQSEVDKCQKVYEATKKDCDRQIEEYEKKIFGLEEYADGLKCSIDRKQYAINQIDGIICELFGVAHSGEIYTDDFKELLREKSAVGKTITDFLPTEPIKVADMLINVSIPCKFANFERTVGILI